MTAAADESAARAHDFDRIDDQADAFVLRCSCGWVSPPSRSAEAVGTAWDVHRRERGASDW